MSKAKKPPVDRAVATIKKSTGTDALKVSVTNDVGQAMQQSPNWSAATDVQSAVKVWTAGAELHRHQREGDRQPPRAAQGRRSQAGRAPAGLGGREEAGAHHRHRVLRRLRGHGEGRSTSTSSPGPWSARSSAPANLTVNPGKVLGEVASAWDKGLATHGFLVQHATDPTNAATVSGPTPSTKPKFTLGGMPQGASLSLRVAAINPASTTGMSPWSAWVLGNAR